MPRGGWGTGNEIRYIDGLISNRWTVKELPSPEILLASYIRSAKRRKAWGTFENVNADKVIKHAEDRLSVF